MQEVIDTLESTGHKNVVIISINFLDEWIEE
jgi:hypothetical protein